ncbi:MAG: flagellar biosynthesis repressor FlbT [Rhodobacteraceae bacterium]|nr:flagellar biosynthesis repressor FlbT [Paracoccaceae bacterium]
MALQIDLRPHERLIVGNTIVHNGKRETTLFIETQERVMRGRDIMQEDEANTPCKRLYLCVQMMYLSTDPAPYEDVFREIATPLMRDVPDLRRQILDIIDELSVPDHYRALRACRDLIKAEAALLQKADT